ncbi:hypothetical protein ACROYT_G000889 [Oculina patagonica]
MDNRLEVSHAIFIGIVVATFLFKTFRVLKSIEVCKECLVLLNKKVVENEKRFVNVCSERIYLLMYQAYFFISDYSNVIHYGQKLLPIHREQGEKAEEGALSLVLANLYQGQRKFAKAKDLYEKAIDIMIDTGNKQGEATAYQKLGTLFLSLGEYGKAKGCLKKALEIRIAIGDRDGEGLAYAKLGSVFKYVGEHDKAEGYLKRALAITKELGNRQGEGAMYGNLGTVFQFRGEYIKAKKYFEEALTIMTEVGDKKGEAAVCANLGTIFKSLGEYAMAKGFLVKSLAIMIESKDKEGEAASYGNLGTVFQLESEYMKAKEYHEKSLEITRNIGDRQGEATAYVNLGTTFQCLGEYLKAKEYQQKALAIRVEMGEISTLASCYRNLGNVFNFLGENVKAEEHFKKALEITTTIKDRHGEASAYGSLGSLYQSLGKYAQAKEFLERALVIRKEIGDIEGEAANYGDLGNTYRLLGEYTEARNFTEKALALRIKIGDRNGQGTAYGNLGTLFTHVGEYVKAKEYFEKSLAINKEIGNREGEAAAYGNLGVVFSTFGENFKAKEYFEKALVMAKVIGDRGREGATYASLGTVFHDLGNYAKAKEYLERALAIREEIGDKKGESGDYVNLGTVFQSLGQNVKAKEYLEKALAISTQIGDKNGETACYANLGTTFQFLGDYSKAAEYHEKALVISENIGDIKMQLHCHCSLAWVKCLKGNGQNAFENLVASIHTCEKLRVFLKNNDQFKIFLLDSYASPYLMLSTMFCVSGDPGTALYVLELGRARALADLLATQYSVENQISSNPQSWVGMESVMKKENDCTCLYVLDVFKNVSLWIIKTSGNVTFRRREFEINSNVQSNEVFRRFYISTKEYYEDRSLVSLNRKQLTSNSSQKDCLPGFRLVEEDEENQEPEPSLAQFYQMIIAPVADLLKEPEIIIVPDRALYRIPFAALPDESGKYLSETFRIRIVPSLMTLKIIQDSPADYHCQTGAVIVGDPKVGRVLYKGRVENISRLPCAGKEAEMIGRVLGVNPLLGEHATKQAVLQSINSVSLIHFAAHGDAERGEIALAPLRSTEVTPQEEDYLLTMAEISKVQLRAKLVVLSCCHSGQGDIKVEGVVGIARAFLGSGARSVLVALWAIEDSATEQFMGRFYEHLVAGKSASECLHEAMKWMRANGYPDVRQWAPFMLIGDNVTFNFGNKGASATG